MIVRWYQILADITLNLVSYCTFWFSKCRSLSKLRHIKQEAEYLFCTGRNWMRIIISSIICHVKWYQRFPDITLNLVRYLYLLIINMPFVIKIVTYKMRNWVFILHRKKCYTHNYIRHHLPRQKISRYHAQSRQLLVPFDHQYPFFVKILANRTSSWVFIFCIGGN